MKRHGCKILLVLLQCSISIAPFELRHIGEQLDNIFLKPDITAEESRAILASARESYLSLKGYEGAKEAERRRAVVRRLENFPPLVMDDLARQDMTLQRLFEDMRDYLKGDVNPPDNDAPDRSALSRAVREILAEAERKVGQHYVKTDGHRYDVAGVLSANGSDVENIIRAYSIKPSSIGYFFLESFATILGLSWGIVSMILADTE